MQHVLLNILRIGSNIALTAADISLSVTDNSFARVRVATSFLRDYQKLLAVDFVGRSAEVIGRRSAGGKNIRIFVGSITTAELIIDGGLQTMQITVHAPGLRAGHPGPLRVFADAVWGNLVSRVAEDAGTTVAVTSGAEVNCGPLIVQQFENDFDFLRRVAYRLGMVVFYDGTRWVATEWTANKQVATLTAKHSNALRFAYRNSPRSLGATERTENDQDWNDQELTVPNSGMAAWNQLRSGTHDDWSVIHHPAYPLAGTAASDQRRITLKREAALRDAYRGAVELSGSLFDAPFGVGDGLKVSGLPHVPSGEQYRCYAIDHRFKNGMYEAAFRACPAEQCLVPAPQLPHPAGISLLAKVTDNLDPDRLGRVRMTFPRAWYGEQSPWLHVTTGFCTDGGTHFAPAVDEEVLITASGVWLDEHPPVVQPLPTANQRKAFEPHFRGWKSGDAHIMTDERTGNVIIRGNRLSLQMSDGVEIASGGELKLSGTRIDLN